MLLVYISISLKSVLKYKCLMLDTCHSGTQYVRQQGSVVIFRRQKGSASKKFGKRWSRIYSVYGRWTYINMGYWWNFTDSRKPKHSKKKPVPVPRILHQVWKKRHLCLEQEWESDPQPRDTAYQDAWNYWKTLYRGADKSLARATSLCILMDGENISLMLLLLYLYIHTYIHTHTHTHTHIYIYIYIYIYSTNIPPIMIIKRIYEHQNLLSL